MPTTETESKHENMSPEQFVRSLEKAADIQVTAVTTLKEAFSKKHLDDAVGYSVETRNNRSYRTYEVPLSFNIAGNTRLVEAFSVITTAREQLKASSDFSEDVKKSLSEIIERSSETLAIKHNFLVLAQMEADKLEPAGATEEQIAKRSTQLVIEKLYGTTKDYNATIVEGPSGINIFMSQEQFQDFMRDTTAHTAQETANFSDLYFTQSRKIDFQGHQEKIRVIVAQNEGSTTNICVSDKVMQHEEQHTLNSILGNLEQRRAWHTDARFTGHENDLTYTNSVLRRAAHEIAGNAMDARNTMEINRRLLDPSDVYNFKGILTGNPEATAEYTQIIKSATRSLGELTNFYATDAHHNSYEEDQLFGRMKALAVLENFPITDWSKIAYIMRRYSAENQH